MQDESLNIGNPGNMKTEKINDLKIYKNNKQSTIKKENAKYYIIINHDKQETKPKNISKEMFSIFLHFSI